MLSQYQPYFDPRVSAQIPLRVCLLGLFLHEPRLKLRFCQKQLRAKGYSDRRPSCPSSFTNSRSPCRYTQCIAACRESSCSVGKDLADRLPNPLRTQSRCTHDKAWFRLYRIRILWCLQDIPFAYLEGALYPGSCETLAGVFPQRMELFPYLRHYRYRKSKWQLAEPNSQDDDNAAVCLAGLIAIC